MVRNPGVRYRSKVYFYGHFVWATKHHTDVLSPDLERAAHRCIASEAQRLGCIVLALGGMPDHVHLVVRLPASVAVMAVAKQLKGASARLVNTLRLEFSEPFSWQDGYGFFSIGPSDAEQATVMPMSAIRNATTRKTRSESNGRKPVRWWGNGCAVLRAAGSTRVNTGFNPQPQPISASDGSRQSAGEYPDAHSP